MEVLSSRILLRLADLGPELGQISAYPFGHRSGRVLAGVRWALGRRRGRCAGRLDLDGAAAPGGFDEFPDGPVGLVLDPAADLQRREAGGSDQPLNATGAKRVSRQR